MKRRTRYPPSRALDDPHLPERLGAVERWDMMRPRALQLLHVARTRKTSVPEVVAMVEVAVVHPQRVALDRGPGEDLAVERIRWKARGKVSRIRRVDARRRAV